LNRFFEFILTSSLMDLLTEYSVPGQSIGHGTLIGTTTVPTPPLRARHMPVTETRLRKQLKRWIAQGTIPRPTRNTLYFVYLPPGVTTVMAADRSRSCKDVCGYHNNVQGTEIRYAVEPYVTCKGCRYGRSVVDSLTKISSHELCEAITDPEGGGWYDDTSGDEMGDVCNDKVAWLGGYLVQKEWSDSRRICVA
jgi:hypothetical protein